MLVITWLSYEHDSKVEVRGEGSTWWWHHAPCYQPLHNADVIQQNSFQSHAIKTSLQTSQTKRLLQKQEKTCQSFIHNKSVKCCKCGLSRLKLQYVVGNLYAIQIQITLWRLFSLQTTEHYLIWSLWQFYLLPYTYSKSMYCYVTSIFAHQLVIYSIYRFLACVTNTHND